MAYTNMSQMSYAAQAAARQRAYQNWVDERQKDYFKPEYDRSRGYVPADHWSSVLGVSHSATVDEIKAAYRKLAKAAHSDAGGSDEQMTRLNVARDTAIQERGCLT